MNEESESKREYQRIKPNKNTKKEDEGVNHMRIQRDNNKAEYKG